MDIQIASNFERYLYYLCDENSQKVQELMDEFAHAKKLDFSEMLGTIQRDFKAKCISEDATEKTIKDFYEKYNYILDPHTAVGVNAALSLRNDDTSIPVVSLSTAHPAKFGAAVNKAIKISPDLPTALAGLESKESRCEILDADINKVKSFISKNAL